MTVYEAECGLIARARELHGVGDLEGAAALYQKALVEEGEKVTAPAPTIKGEEIARIAWDHYRRLDISLLKAFQETNAHIQDWNQLDSSTKIQLPEISGPKGGYVDFYSIQIITRRSKEALLIVADKLLKQGAQNIFVIEDPLNKDGVRWIRVCVGVFGEKSESLELMNEMRKKGFKDAFPIRLMNRRLDEILYP